MVRSNLGTWIGSDHFQHQLPTPLEIFMSAMSLTWRSLSPTGVWLRETWSCRNDITTSTSTNQCFHQVDLEVDLMSGTWPDQRGRGVGVKNGQIQTGYLDWI